MALARVRVFSLIVIAACSHDGASTPDLHGSHIEACGIAIDAFAGGIVRIHYGEPTPPSWAVVGATDPDPDAMVDRGELRTAALVARITDCRVHAELADGTVAIDDAVAYEPGKLVRTAQPDKIYGLGERTGGLDRRGRAWTFWNTDAYDPAVGGWHPGQDPMYQSIPLEVHLAASAFGLFTDATRRMTIDLTDPARDVTTVSGGIDQLLIPGPRIADVVDRYTQLTGRPMLPPRWALGFHQSRWGYANAGEVESVAAQFRALGIPADAIWLDIQHMRGFRTFTFDPQAFPDPAAMTARLAAQGFHVVAIEDPGIKIDPGWEVYDSLDPAHAFTGTAWAGASAFPDFSHPAMRTWWGQQVDRVLDLGVSGVWLDVNEPTTFPEGGGGTTLPDELAVDGDGHPTTMAALHNAYALFEARATYEAMAARTGDQRPFVLSRAGYAGIQRYAAVWTGDTPSTWDGLQQTLPMLLGLGLSGVPIVGSDIGGYSGHASPELYARWLALGSISPFSRAHVTSGVPGQEPWQFGDEVTAAARDWLGERYRILPYILSAADEASRTGAPILRPLVWEFQDDRTVRDLADEAMLGSGLLVAPVVEPGAQTRRVYLPAGRWYEVPSDAIVDGPVTIDVPLRLAALPMFARAGAIIPSGSLALDVYPGTGTFTLYEDGIGRTTITTDGTTVTIDHDGGVPARDVVVRMHRVDGGVMGVDGAAWTYDTDARTLAATVHDAPHVALAFHYDPAIADPRPPVPITFEVHVPAGSSPVYVATSANGWTHVPLPWVAPGVARGQLVVPRGDWVDYKYTRGDWTTVEKAADCTELSNRYRVGAAGVRVDTVAAWRDHCGN